MAKIAVYNEFRIGVVTNDGIHDATALLADWRPGRADSIVDFIDDFASIQPALVEIPQRVPAIPLTHVTLRAAVPRPGQILAAPLNFQAHRDEMDGPLTAGPGTAETLGFFLKSPRSVADPSSDVLLPNLPGRRFDFEAEIAVVIGRSGQAIPMDAALDHVFGYTLALDMTLRMSEDNREERTMRKSFATFTPLGPWIVTSDEIPDPSRLNIKAWRNDELCQDAWLSDLIVDVPGLIARASQVVRLEPGDVYSTGSPAGVGQVAPGDRLIVECREIGRLEMGVASRPW